MKRVPVPGWLPLAAALALAASPANAAGPVLSGLRIEQPIVARQGLYDIRPEVHVRFTLSRPAEVAVTVARHLATGGRQAEYLAEPFPVRTLRPGRLPAGRHTMAWDGLNNHGDPVLETQPLTKAEVWGLKERPPRPGQLVKQVPVQLFRVTVRAGDDTAAANFRRLEPGVYRGPEVAGYLADGVRDGEGRFYFMDRSAWRGRRFSAALEPEVEYPGVPGHYNSNVPVSGTHIAVDGRGNVHAQGQNAVFRYRPDGRDYAWEADADYVNGPALGVRLDPNGEGTYWVRGKPVKYSAAVAREKAKVPGHAHVFGGMAVDRAGNLYLARVDPEPRQIQVFDRTGRFRRALPAPPGTGPYDMETVRVGTDGAVWVGGSNPTRLNPQTGAVEGRIKALCTGFTVGPDGTIYGFSHLGVSRFTPRGELKPFTARAPYVADGGQRLDILYESSRVPPGTPGYVKAILTVLGGPAGDLYVVPMDRREWEANPKRPLLHFTAEGQYLPEPVRKVVLTPHRPGNVFVGGEPARFDLQATWMDPHDAALTVEWTLTDFDGAQTRGGCTLTIKAFAHQVLPFAVPATAFGHYRLEGTVRHDGGEVSRFATTLARIRSRDLAWSPDSPFGMCWGKNFYLMGLAGVKKERVGTGGTFDAFTPLEGVTMPDLPDAPQFGFTAQRAYADRWGVRMAEMFSYGEPWTNPGWLLPIHRYDRWLGELALPLLDRWAGTRWGGANLPHYQFWNEIDNFWQVPGPFGREHCILVQKHCWSMVKARDREARSVADGDSSGTRMMVELAQHGGDRYHDAVTCHYPETRDVPVGRGIRSGLPEGKAVAVRDVIAVRDRSFPGKPVLNTEDGWWMDLKITPAQGAEAMPRVYLPQVAAGVDEIYWYAMGSSEDATNASFLLGPGNVPNPSYCSYATMTRLLEGAACLGPVDLGGPGRFGFLFGRGEWVILPVWCAAGEAVAPLRAGVDRVTVTDLMDRQTELHAVGGALPLRLSTRVQYLEFPRNDWAAGVARAELARRLASLKLRQVSELSAAIAEAGKTASADPAAMNRLFHLVQAARQAALAGEAPASDRAPSGLAKAAHAAIRNKEGADGYLRQARVALGWTQRLARLAQRQRPLAGQVAWATVQAAAATHAIATVEMPDYPGIAVNAFLEPRAVRQGADPAKGPVDTRFPFEIARKPGESFELELTVWDYYRHPVHGIVTPRLPAGWRASPGQAAYSVAPGRFQRFVFTVTIPADTRPGVYPVGGQTVYGCRKLPEIHTQRVRVGGR